MSKVPSAAARAARSVASSPAVAGFRPAGAALAVAAAFALQPLVARAQAVGAQVIHGSATFARNGGNLVVTTQNGAGTNFSSINWQSFSVPAGTVTRFDQPSATSTSINRVIGPDPSAIYGTLSSNGRLVLVNPAGITVGQGAVVDTAAFTASTLNMSDADALAGRLRFGAPSGGLLQVDGHVIARSGDVVLVAPQLQTGSSALIQSQGATVLAAGHKVEITGRGLEGIQMEVQAGDQAVNLGTLQGDAVGIFADTLKHSGVIEAQGVSIEGGKVVLKAGAGDALVDGHVAARASDGRGGAIDLLGHRVRLLAGANLDASGAAGGGQVRVGGDYQGRNASVPNAARTYVDANATIRADATQQGDGGRVIVWSDEATRMDGTISARGGAQGGNGGFVEVSSKQYLAFRGGVDLSAPQGRSGSLLLDPDDITITATGPDTEPSGANGNGDTEFSGGVGTSTISAATLNSVLSGGGNVLITTSAGNRGPLNGQITLAAGADVNWTGSNSLSLQADAGIGLQGNITGLGGTLSLTAANGGISQTGGILQVGSLYASANNGAVSLASTGNRIGTVAGAASGTNASFALTASGINSLPLMIGTVAAGPASSPYASGNGIVVGNGAGGGDVNVKAANGGVEIVDGSSVSAQGNLTLTAADSINIGNSAVVSGGNTVSLSAAGNLIAGSNASVGAGSGGVTVQSGGSIDFGLGNVNISTSNGPIKITAAGDIGGNVSLNTFGSNDATGAAGSVSITATGGALSFGSINTAGTDGALHGGNVTISAAGDVSAAATEGFNIDTHGGPSAQGQGGAGGTISITSNGGQVAVAAINSTGGDSGTPASSTVGPQPGAAAGAITISARQNVTLQTIQATGGYASAGNAGAGGTVSITSSAGGITVSNGITTYGGSVTVGSIGPFGGGQGGDITLSATQGNVQVHSISAGGGGGNGGGVGGQGGTITVTAGGQAQVESISATGGGSDNGTGGNGGNVAITAGGDVVLTFSSEFLSIDVDGGSSNGGRGGAGGNVSLSSSGGGVRAYTLQTSVASPSGGITAAGGFGAGAGQGGTVNIQSAGDMTVADVHVDAHDGFGLGGADGGTISLHSAGGNIVAGLLSALGGGSNVSESTGTGTGSAGRGGTIDVSGTKDISVAAADASGGYSSTSNAGAGGTISITSTGGNLTTGWLEAYGGSVGLSSVAPFGGGAGGAITLSASKGSVTSDWIEAFGGEGDGGVGGQGGTVGIHALNDINLQSTATPVLVDVHGGSSATATGGSAGSVSLVSSSGGIHLSGPTVSTVSTTTTQAAATTAPAPVVVGGEIFAFGGSGAPGGNGGQVVLQAAQNVDVGEILENALQSTSTGGAGGTVSITAGGTANVLAVLAWGGDTEPTSSGAPASGNAGNGGKVTISGAQGVMVSEVDSSGGFATGGGHAGKAGDISISSSGGSIQAGFLGAFGGPTGLSMGTSGGGAGANVVLTATAGNVSAGAIDVAGSAGEAGGAGGNAGNVTVSAGGGVALGSVTASGGFGTGSAQGGAGGKVSVTGPGGITIGGAGYGIIADGGGSEQGVAGAGGSVSLVSSGGPIQLLATTTTDSGTTTVAAAAPAASGISALGGFGGTGGKGGSVLLDAASGISVGGITVDGGQSSGSARQAGGAGGSIQVSTGGGLAAGPLEAKGGAGADGTSGGSGGAGGTITVQAKSGDLNLANSAGLMVSGGTGGNATAGGTGSGGQGGAGGSISLSSPGGAVLLAGNLLDASGGAGGLNADDTTHAASGPLGTLTVNSASLDVQGDVNVNAQWANKGTLTGTGTLTLSGGSGTLDNFGTISPAGSAIGTLAINGNVTMEPGSMLAMDLLSPTAFDVLSISGTAQTGGSLVVNLQPGASFASGDRFDLLQAGLLDAATLPSVNVPQFALQASGNTLQAVANGGTPPAPAPTPAPAPSPAQAPAVQQVQNQVVTFAQLFVQEAQQQDGTSDKPKAKDAIVVTDNACKP